MKSLKLGLLLFPIILSLQASKAKISINSTVEGVSMTAEDVALGFFYAWSKERNPAKSCEFVAEDATLDGGFFKLNGRAEYCAAVLQGHPWRDVALLKKVVAGSSVAIIYQGVDEVTGKTMRASDFIEVKNGLISNVITAVSELP